jgi:hypothetical protein
MVINISLNKRRQELARLRVSYNDIQVWHRAILYAMFPKKYWKAKKVKYRRRNIVSVDLLVDLINNNDRVINDFDRRFFKDLFKLIVAGERTRNCTLYISY